MQQHAMWLCSRVTCQQRGACSEPERGVALHLLHSGT